MVRSNDVHDDAYPQLRQAEVLRRAQEDRHCDMVERVDGHMVGLEEEGGGRLRSARPARIRLLSSTPPPLNNKDTQPRPPPPAHTHASAGP